MWLCIRLDNAGKWTCDRPIEDVDFGKKKIISSEEAHFDLGGEFGAQKTRTHKLKSRRTQNESLCVANFGPEA